MTKYIVRVVTEQSEVEEINKFIQAVAAFSCSTSYTPKQVELLNAHVFGIHDGDGAIDDKTFFVIESDGKIIATGGWSIRKQKLDADPLLIPGTDPARIRTFFVDPSYNKSGLGTLLLQLCENAALEAGFISSILYATLNGESFYHKQGYTKIKSLGYGISAPPLEGETLEFIFMGKSRLIKHDIKSTLEAFGARGIEINLAVEPVRQFNFPALRG
jgi:GNAT superfamily N-acetyltransferase